MWLWSYIKGKNYQAIPERGQSTWWVSHIKRTSEVGTKQGHLSATLLIIYKNPLYRCFDAMRYTTSDLYGSSNLLYKYLCFSTSSSRSSLITTGFVKFVSDSFSKGSEGYACSQISLHLFNAYSSFSSSKIVALPINFKNLDSQYLL